MNKSEKTLALLQAGKSAIAFRDLQTLLTALGFRLDRISGSHHLYVHGKASRPLNVQPDGKDTKPYQLKQLRAMISEFGLTLDLQK